MNFKGKIIISSLALLPFSAYASEDKEERFVNHTNQEVSIVSNIAEKISSESKYLIKRIINIPAGYNIYCKELSEESMCSNIFVSNGKDEKEKFIGIPNNDKAKNYKYYIELIKGHNRLENHMVDFSDIKTIPPFMFQVVKGGQTSLVNTDSIEIDPNNQSVTIYKIESFTGAGSIYNFNNPTDLYSGTLVDGSNISSIAIENGEGVIELQNNTCNDSIKIKNCSFSIKVINKNSPKIPKLVIKDANGKDVKSYNILIDKVTEVVEERSNIQEVRLAKLHRDSLYNVREIINIPEKYSIYCEPNVVIDSSQNIEPTENCVSNLIFDEAFHETVINQKTYNAYFIATSKGNSNNKYKIIFRNSADNKEIPLTISFQDNINGEVVEQIEKNMYYAKPTLAFKVSPESSVTKIYELNLNNKTSNSFEITFNDVSSVTLNNLKTLKSRNSASISLSKVKPNHMKADFSQNYTDFFTVINNSCAEDISLNNCYIELKGKKLLPKNKVFLSMTNKDNINQDFSISVDNIE